ncbi:MAG TPA: hypothetical protein VK493_08415, partial [Bryobacteraceae bacterium]|nr:hypothetical protein [Bryobacteraceae bacterium]
MRLIMAFVVSTLLAAQQTGRNAPPGSYNAGTFTSTTQLVVETVSVTDKEGHPVEGLTAKDLTVTENGVPQEIRFFEEQKLRDTAGDVLAARSSAENIHVYDKLTRTQIVAESPGNTRYKDRRLLALYFDMTAMRPADQSRALGAAQKFIRTQMKSADLMAILRYSGGAVDV